MPNLGDSVSLLGKGFTISSEAVQSVIRVIFAPWWATSEPVREFLDAHPTTGSAQVADTDDLTLSWADRKLAEHSFVGITCALLAGVVSAAFSWQNLDTLPWATRGLWNGSLLMDLASICLATQQSLTLNRICCYRDRCQRIRDMLRDAGGRPRGSQLFVWQTPIMLLNVGVVLFVIGMVNLIFSNFETPRSNHDTRTLVLVALAGSFAGLTYFSSYLILYSQTLPRK